MNQRALPALAIILLAILVPIVRAQPSLTASLDHWTIQAPPDPARPGWSTDGTTLRGQTPAAVILSRHPIADAQIDATWRVEPGSTFEIWLGGRPAISMGDAWVGSGAVIDPQGTDAPLVRGDNRPGDTNSLRLRVDAGRVTVWVNGLPATIASAVPGAATLDGPIGFRPTRGAVELRDLTITPLPGSRAPATTLSAGARLAIILGPDAHGVATFVETHLRAAAPHMAVAVVALPGLGEPWLERLALWAPDLVVIGADAIADRPWSDALARIASINPARPPTLLLAGPRAADDIWLQPGRPIRTERAAAAEAAHRAARTLGVAYLPLHEWTDVAVRAGSNAFGAFFAAAGPAGDGRTPAMDLLAAMSILEALNAPGEVGRLTLTADPPHAHASPGHTITAAEPGLIRIDSRRYPPAQWGDERQSSGPRAIGRIIPVADRLTRLVLTAPAPAPVVRLWWGTEFALVSGGALEAGVNLASLFVLRPTDERALEVEAAVAAKRRIELDPADSPRAWLQRWNDAHARADAATAAPVAHVIRIEPFDPDAPLIAPPIVPVPIPPVPVPR